MQMMTSSGGGSSAGGCGHGECAERKDCGKKSCAGRHDFDEVVKDVMVVMEKAGRTKEITLSFSR